MSRLPRHRRAGDGLLVPAGLVLCLIVATGAAAQPLTNRAAMHAQLLATSRALDGATTGADLGLRQAFDAAWALQPEAASLAARQAAATAEREVADSWTPQPAAVGMSGRTDRATRNEGGREYEAGLAIPLWLPGERARSQDLADARITGVQARLHAARLRTAAEVRAAYWNWQLARIEQAVANDRLLNAQTLASDVGRRVAAGDLARADQNQAEGNLAAAQSALAESRSMLAAASQDLRAVTGLIPPAEPAPVPLMGPALEPAPVLPQVSAPIDLTHPMATHLLAQADIARQAVQLAQVQTRSNPELTLATTRERGAFADRFQQTVTVGVRIPFGSDARNRARLSAANADAQELESQVRLTRERLLADLESARQQLAASNQQVDAAQRRARLANETRGFFERSFRLGETDLPTRLRIELEAAESERQQARARISQAAAVSALRQSLGLLPE